MTLTLPLSGLQRTAIPIYALQKKVTLLGFLAFFYEKFEKNFFMRTQKFEKTQTRTCVLCVSTVIYTYAFSILCDL